MHPIFGEHPMIRQFNELKKYFRRHETDVTRERIQAFRDLAAEFRESKKVNVAFDFMGSINFGLATPTSDVDLVIYLECDSGFAGECTSRFCTARYEIELQVNEFLTQKMGEIFEIQILDCININLLNFELKRGVKDSRVLMRFAFYRSVCRAVNSHWVRPLHEQLQNNKQLVSEMYPDIELILEHLAHSSRHSWSFHKYLERLAESGIDIPPDIREKINAHLKSTGGFLPD